MNLTQSPVMITLDSDLAAMRQAGRLVALAHRAIQAALRPGVSPKELDAVAEKAIREGGGRPAFKGYHGFPSTICASPNEVVIHGIPNGKKLQEGDIISVDIGAEFEGFFGDSAWTYAVGEVAPDARRLLEVTEASLYAGIDQARAGNTVEEVSGAIQDVVEAAGFSLVREYCGHGIGRVLHGEPEVLNYRTGRKSPVLKAGQGLAIEPMVNLGGPEVYTKKDKWTVVTKDGKWSAHFEHTMIIGEGPAEITTRTKGIG